MMNLEEKKEQEIRNFVDILKQIDLSDIILLTRDANTLLMRQKEMESRKLVTNKQREGETMRNKYVKTIYVRRHQDGTQEKYVGYRDDMGRVWSRGEIAKEIAIKAGIALMVLMIFTYLLCGLILLIWLITT